MRLVGLFFLPVFLMTTLIAQEDNRNEKIIVDNVKSFIEKELKSCPSKGMSEELDEIIEQDGSIPWQAAYFSAESTKYWFLASLGYSVIVTVLLWKKHKYYKQEESVDELLSFQQQLVVQNKELSDTLQEAMTIVRALREFVREQQQEILSLSE